VGRKNSIKPYFGVGVKVGLTRKRMLRAEYQIDIKYTGVDVKNDNVQAMLRGAAYSF
jgi:hypothetical protein